MIKQIIENVSVLESILSTDELGTTDDAGLNRSQRRVVLTIGKFEGLTIGKIQHRCSMTKGNFSIICDKLHKQGHIERNYSTDDRRKVHIYLTDSGRDLYRRYEQIICQRYSDFLDNLNLTEQSLFEGTINNISGLLS